MLSGKVDATLAAFWNVEGVELRARARPSAPTITPVDRLGVPDYDELVLVANADELDEQRDDLRLFIGALRQGSERGAQRPARRRAGPAGGEPRPEAAARPARASASRCRRCSPASGKPVGLPRPRRSGATYGAWMVENDLLKSGPVVDEALTNELLPGEGL